MPSSVSWSSQSSVESGVWLARERVLGKFEDDWRSGSPPELSAYLSDPSADFDLLVELVHADLEYRIKFGHEARVESYLQRFPELSSQAEIVLDLIETEYRARTRAGHSESIDSYRSRFPDLGEQLSERLGSVGHEESRSPETSLYLPQRETKIGQVGKFELYQKIGVGGFGEVYRGRDPELDRPVAVKLALAHRLSDNMVERFIREARACAQLRHPNLLAIFDAGKAENGSWYIATAYLPGGTLQEQLRKRKTIPFRESVEWIAQAAEGLQYAHEQKIIHRDIKPANLMLDERGRVQVVDFGLARRPEVDAGMTIDGSILGTPVYMSPEQAAGQVRRMDHRTDVYSLGASLYHLLTGTTPFRGTPSSVIHAVLHQEPETPRRKNRLIPRDLDTIVRKAMSKEANNRYQKAGDLADDLRRWLRGDPVTARRLGPFTRFFRWIKRSPVVASLTLGLFLAILLGGSLFAWKYHEASDNFERAEDRNRAAIKNFVAGELLADDGRRLMASLVKSGVIDDLQPALLQHLPATLLDEIAQHFELSLKDDGITRRVAERLKFMSALATIRRVQGRWNDAEAILRDSQAKAGDPRVFDPADRYGLATAMIANGKFAEAINELRLTRETVEQQRPMTSQGELLLLRCAVAQGYCIKQLQKDSATEVLDLLNLVRPLAEGREAHMAGDPEWKLTLAQYFRSRGDALISKNLPKKDASAEYRRAVNLFSDLMQTYPNSDDFPIQLAWTAGSAARLENDTTANELRTTGVEALVRVIKRLDARKKTDNSERLRALLAGATESAGSLFNDLGRMEEAIQMHRRSTEINFQLEKEFHRHGYLHGARSSVRNLTRALVKADRHDEAIDTLFLRRDVANTDAGELWQTWLDTNRLAQKLTDQNKPVPVDLTLLQQDLSQRLSKLGKVAKGKEE